MLKGIVVLAITGYLGLTGIAQDVKKGKPLQDSTGRSGRA